jgi:DinB family protein
VTAISGESLPAWYLRLAAELNAAGARADTLARPLSAEQINWKPSPQQWSIGQCLEHLSLSNETYVPAIVDALAGPATGPVEEITPGWFGRWFIRNYIEPSPATRRGRAPKKIVPSSRVDPDILGRFLHSNDEVRKLARRAAGYDVNRVRFRNPYLSVIRFTVGTGLVLLPAHERRHLLQAERVRESDGFPSR